MCQSQGLQLRGVTPIQHGRLHAPRAAVAVPLHNPTDSIPTRRVRAIASGLICLAVLPRWPRGSPADHAAQAILCPPHD
jgi:hypothetical protein